MDNNFYDPKRALKSPLSDEAKNIFAAAKDEMTAAEKQNCPTVNGKVTIRVMPGRHFMTWITGSAARQT